MRCLPGLTIASDNPFWVPRKSFLAEFDQEDFHRREARNVTPAYLTDWFSPGDPPRFMLPAVQFVGGQTQFISGRHRIAVLLPYLFELPMSFTCHELFRRRVCGAPYNASPCA